MMFDAARAGHFGGHVNDGRSDFPAQRGLQPAGAPGIGATVLACFAGDGDPRLQRMSPPLPEFDHGLWLLTHEDLRGAARVRALLDFLAAAVRSERPRLKGARP